MNAAAPGRCSQLSTISSRCLAARKRSTACSADSPASGDDRERADDRGGNVLRSFHRRERHEVRAVGEVGLDGARGLEREPGLADTTGPGQGQQANRARAQALADRADLTSAADRAIRRRRQRAAAIGGGRHRHIAPGRRRARVATAPPASAGRATGLGAGSPRAGAAARRRARRRRPRQGSGGRRGRPQAPRPAVRCDTARASAAAASRSRVGCSARSCRSSLTSAACDPRARSASTRASNATSRCSSSRAISAAANGSNSKSASAGPCHSSSASRNTTPARSRIARLKRAPTLRDATREALGVKLARTHPQPVARRRGR